MKKLLTITPVILLVCLMVFLLSCNDEQQSSPKETIASDLCQNGHTSVIDEAVAPTCVEKGLTEGAHCSACNEIMIAQTDIDALGHRFGEWRVESEPTCNTEGSRIRKCSACGESEMEVIGAGCVSNETVSIDLNGYSIVYADGHANNTYFLSEINRVSDALGLTSSLTTEGRSTATDKEILIGLTSRSESKEARDAIHGTGYTVRRSGKKIVIVGTDDTMTLAALNYFINNCTVDSDKKLTISEKFTFCNATYVPFANSKGSEFVFVLDHDLDRDPANAFVNNSTDLRDFPCTLIEKLIKNISNENKASESSFKITTDEESKQLEGYEVLFGIVDRAESNAYRMTLDAHEYGFTITDKKLIITAHNDLALEDAVDAFSGFYKYLMTCTDGKLPIGYQYKGRVEDQNWITDFPRPEGENVNISFSQHNNDDSLQILYEGAGVNVEAFLAYCAKLEAAGYTIVTKNDNPGNTGSYFRTYKNVETEHAIYVAFNAFKFEEVYADVDRKNDHVLKATVTNKTVYYPMRDYNPCLRIVSAPLSKAYLPTDDITKDNYNRETDKITESSVTAMRYFEDSVGMGYIIQLEDGSFFIIDGGNKNNNDVIVLYNTLVELYKKSHNGQEPSVDNPLHIKAWLITHSHGDHYNTASDFLLRYGKLAKTITMDYLIGNFPEEYSVYSIKSGILTMGNGEQIPKMQSYVPGGFEYIKVHTGQVLYLANLMVEIVMTTEDHAPFRINVANDTNTITKLTIRSDNKDTTWMVLGDACLYQSRWLCAMWGGDTYNTSTGLYENSYLTSNMVQLAHHGNIGCEIALYRTIQGEVLWFPHNSSAYNSYVHGGSTHWRAQVDKYVAKTLKTMKYIFVSGWYNDSKSFKEYHDSITLQFNADGPDFNDIWGVNYRKTNKAVVSSIPFNSGTGKIVDSPIIKK